MIKKLMKKFKDDEQGLTLVELLAVIVILAIISVIAFVFIGGIIENSKKDAHIANAQQVISAAKLHEATGGKISGDGISVAKLQEKDYLDLIIDPWSKEEYNDLGNVTVKTEETKIDGEDRTLYKIEGFSASDGDCTISKNELELTGDRDDICSSSTGG